MYVLNSALYKHGLGRKADIESHEAYMYFFAV